jgi:Holliday junction resolvase
MAKSNYQSGKRAEMNCAKQLEGEGYIVVTSRGSHGLFDVVAIGSTHVRCVQVKRNCYLSAVEREALQLAVVASNCSKELWRYETGSSKPVSVEVIK